MFSYYNFNVFIPIQQTCISLWHTAQRLNCLTRGVITSLSVFLSLLELPPILPLPSVRKKMMFYSAQTIPS